MIVNRLFWFWASGSLLLYVALLLFVTIVCVAFTGPVPVLQQVRSPDILFAVQLSVRTATVSTLLSLLIGLPAAYRLAHYQGRFKDIVDGLLDIPLVLPPIAIGAALLVFFSQFPSREPSLDKILGRLGMPILFEVPAIVIAQFAVISGYSLRVLKASFESLNPRTSAVARTLGLNQAQTFLFVELPQAAPGLIAATILLWARAMGEFGATVVLAGATAGKTEVLPISIWLAMQAVQFEKALAAAIVLIIVSLGALFLFRSVTRVRL
ncbi:MAG: ABC transporter permease [Armatimonadetes bacterium]|nr:ABC transporter permease [Armatimonadota bacterium]MDW8122771.1 ABC transporter permease [Armatimonadota bacterium]